MSQTQPASFLPTIESVRQHRVPAWYHEAKLGIFVHWGLYSVPAFAPPTAELGAATAPKDWFAYNPYSEWYMNTVRIGYGPSYDYHVQRYGKDFDYNDFVRDFKGEQFDPAAWARLFKASGARYVVPTTKHHDGFCLWGSRYTDFNSVCQGPRRDLIGDLSSAVRAEGLKLGLYYSGILDWQYCKKPITNMDELYFPTNITAAYADYAYNQVMELIERFKPEVLWNDIAWPHKGLVDLPMLLSYYYNEVQEGVINDRWGGVWHDFTTKEYQQGSVDLKSKWEMCRGLGLSFAYNREEDESHIISRRGLISLLVHTVSHNGNLLINVGPKADGSIPAIQEQRLRELGAWLEQNGEAIYGTDIWEKSMDRLPDGLCAYYSQKAGRVYALVDGLTAGSARFTLPALGGLCGTPRSLSLPQSFVTAQKQGDDLLLALEAVPEDVSVVVFELTQG